MAQLFKPVCCLLEAAARLRKALTRLTPVQVSTATVGSLGQRPPEEASNGLFQLLQETECRDLPESDSADDEIFHDCNLSSESDKDERLHRMRVCAG